MHQETQYVLIRPHDTCLVNNTRSVKTEAMNRLPGQRIRDARRKRGLSQEQLAELCGWSGQSRVGNYERGIREPSTGDWALLAQALGTSPGALQYGEATPKQGATDVPIVGFAIATPEKDGYFDDMGFPAGAGEAYVPWPTNDRNAYALRVRGDSMQPRIRPGEIIVVEPNAKVSPGDDVIVRTLDGRKMVKQLLLRRSGEVTLGSINQAHPQTTISVDDIESIHLVAGIVPKAGNVKD